MAIMSLEAEQQNDINIYLPLQYGGFRLPFLSVGSAVLLFVIPCSLLVRKMSELSNAQSLRS